jgi:hypothetical protein
MLGALGDKPLQSKAIGRSEAASLAQSNGSVVSLNRLRSMLWACSATPLALTALQGSASEAVDVGTCRLAPALAFGIGTLRWTGRQPSRNWLIGRSRERVRRGRSRPGAD